LTREYAYYVFEATLAHRSDVDRALSILQEVGAELAGDDAFRNMILAPIEVMGSSVWQARCGDPGAHKDRAAKTALVGRELNAGVSARLAAAAIEFSTSGRIGQRPAAPKPSQTSVRAASNPDARAVPRGAPT